LSQLARDLGIVAALGSDLQGKLALKSSPVVSRLNQRAKTLHSTSSFEGSPKNGSVALTVDQDALTELARLDGRPPCART
jgi:hypothetical protein